MVVASGDVRLPRFLRRDAGGEIDRLYRRHSAEVLRYALHVLRSRSDAEDVTQTVFVRALRALERGERVLAPRNWLIKIAHNECHRLIASRKVLVELPDEIAVEPAEGGRAEELRRAMVALPSHQRQALVLRELEGRSYTEIAASLELSVSAVETLIFRARRSLREQLEAAMSCEQFVALLDDPSARSQVRAHARVCPDCATLDRQSRGRKSALKRIASALGLPGWGTWWGAKVAAVALTTATVAAVAVVPHDGTRPSVPPISHLNLVPPRSQPKPVPQTGGTRFTSFPPKRVHASPVVVAPRKVSAIAPAPQTAPRVTPPPSVAIATPPAPAPVPEPPTPAEPPLPPAAAVPSPPAIVSPPAPELPAVTLPAIAVPAPAPALPTVTLPLDAPKVSLP